MYLIPRAVLCSRWPHERYARLEVRIALTVNISQLISVNKLFNAFDIF